MIYIFLNFLILKTNFPRTYNFRNQFGVHSNSNHAEKIHQKKNMQKKRIFSFILLLPKYPFRWYFCNMHSLLVFVLVSVHSLFVETTQFATALIWAFLPARDVNGAGQIRIVAPCYSSRLIYPLLVSVPYLHGYSLSKF